MLAETLCVNGLTFQVRPETTDIKALDEVIVRQGYALGGRLVVEPTDHWLDLGANIGAFSVWAASAGARVTAYEPEPDNFQLLRQNILGYAVEARRAVVTAGITSTRLLYLCPNPDNRYRHHVKPTRGRKPLRVPAEQFAAVVATCQPNAIKMDIEGSEIGILDATHDWGAVRKMVFEYHFDHDRSIPAFHGRVERLRQAFKVFHRPMPDAKTYDYFPAATIVGCWRKTAEDGTG